MAVIGSIVVIDVVPRYICGASVWCSMAILLSFVGDSLPANCCLRCRLSRLCYHISNIDMYEHVLQLYFIWHCAFHYVHHRQYSVLGRFLSPVTIIIHNYSQTLITYRDIFKRINTCILVLQRMHLRRCSWENRYVFMCDLNASIQETSILSKINSR